jgi:hypothetical protein
MKLLETKANYNYGDANVELTIELDDSSLKYIHLAEVDGVKHFTVSTTSIFAYMTNQDVGAEELTDLEFEEDFDSLDNARASVYAKYYELASSVFDKLGK